MFFIFIINIKLFKTITYNNDLPIEIGKGLLQNVPYIIYYVIYIRLVG